MHTLRLLGSASIDDESGPISGPSTQRHRLALLARPRADAALPRTGGEISVALRRQRLHDRSFDAQLPVLLKDSRYAERLPIGTPEVIRTFPYERLKQFYTDWYRPDLMAVIVVGDFDPVAMETRIKTRFGSIPPAAAARPRPVYDVPDQPGTRYTIATDPEATRTTVGISSTMSARDQSTLGAYRQMTIERTFAALRSLPWPALCICFITASSTSTSALLRA